MDSPKLSLDEINHSPRSNGERKIDIGLDLLANPRKQVSSQDDENIDMKRFNLEDEVDKVDKVDKVDLDKLSFNLDGDDNFGNILDDLNKLDMDNDNRSRKQDNYSFDKRSQEKRDTYSNRDKRSDDYKRDTYSNRDKRSDDYKRDTYSRDKRSDDYKRDTYSRDKRSDDYKRDTYSRDKKSNASNRDTYSRRSVKPSFEDIRKEKEELLMKFEKLKRLGNIREVKFNMASDIEEMRFEYNRIMKEKQTEGSIKFSRKMLLAFVTGAEFLNNRFDPFDVKLDGWSESVHENINDYDEIFEELAEKYKSKSKMSPELKLLLTLGGSGFMFHLTNTMFKSSLPGMDDVLKQNPDLMNQFANAAINQMNNGGVGGSQGGGPSGPGAGGGGGMGGLGGIMSALGGMGGGGQSNPPPATPPFMPFNQGTERKEMNTPKDVDDILNELKQNTTGDDNISIIDDSLSRSAGKKKRGKKSSANSVSLDL